MIDDFFLVRPAERADAEAIAGLFRLVYQKTTHPCIDPGFVAAGFDRGDRWLVCVHGERLVACNGLVLHRWNATSEGARSVTLPGYQQHGLGRLLWRDSIRWAAELGETDLLFGTPRSAAACRMCASSLPPMVLFGHDGGANVANGQREIHAFGLIRTMRPCLRAVPLFGPGTTPLFEERTARLSFRDVPATPPVESLVGSPGEHSYEAPCGVGALRYSLMETSRGWSVLVTGADCAADEIDRLFASLLADRPEIRHLSCYVLWDKVDLADRLGFLGLRATAYLPGWHLSGGMRHDCVHLAWLAPGETASDNGMAELLRPISQALAGLPTPATQHPVTARLHPARPLHGLA